MASRGRKTSTTPDVPELDFIGALCEIWSTINYAAYHLVYVRVYIQTSALQTDMDQLRNQDQVFRDMDQVDVVISRAHLAAFFWQLDHFFEALRSAITRGKKEHPTLQYFWAYEKRLEKIERTTTRQEINAYRNLGHEIPGIIGCAWDKKGGRFLHRHLPSINSHEPKESIDLNIQLQQYFEFVANVWFSFAPGDLKEKFPRNFKFPVTVPYSFLGVLPAELRGVPRFEVSLESYDRATVSQEL